MDIRFISSRTELLEGEAVQQLESVARLSGVEFVVGLPDLHPGKGVPVGCAVATREVVYPHLIGNDIGCGMAMWKTDVNLRRLKLGKLEDRICGLENCSSSEERQELDLRGLKRSSCDRSLGTIGGGNHFAELQQIEEIRDEASARELRLDSRSAYVLIHSGSRGLGDVVLQKHLRHHGAGGLSVAAEEGQDYLQSHDHAVSWAKVNREVIARRFSRFFGAELETLLDSPHNFLAREQLESGSVWVHRKGAASADCEPLIIPGSRGALSYLVRPVGPQGENANSLSHGAGRKWRRSECRRRLSDKFERSALQRTPLGGRVICEDSDLLYEEAPQAYKRIETVIEALEKASLISVIASLRPLLTYKTRRAR